MEIDISPSAIMLMIVFSLVGFVYFKRGKTDGPASNMVYGAILVIYPYFVTETLPMLLVGLAVWALAHVLRFG
jgi:hypothetical protein